MYNRMWNPLLRTIAGQQQFYGKQLLTVPIANTRISFKRSVNLVT